MVLSLLGYKDGTRTIEMILVHTQNGSPVIQYIFQYIFINSLYIISIN